MNEVIQKLLWKDEYALQINGKLFSIYQEIVGYSSVNCKPRYFYFVEVAPEYNPTGKTKIIANSIDKLVTKVKDLEYRVSTIK